jgi:ferredoxin-NADP reductase/(2Fe-2S) ferredoxin
MTVNSASDMAVAPFYKFHIFICTNQRAAGHPRSCCADRGSVGLRDYMRIRVKELRIPFQRINTAGCLERCELGPAMVIYPEGVWYTFRNEADIDEILERHVLKGERVERLILENNQRAPKPQERTVLTLKVANCRKLSNDIHDVCLYELVDPAGGDLPPFEAGAHIDVFTGNGLRRSYSLTNSPSERHRYVIGVQREVGGSGGSAWIIDNIVDGGEARISPPLNNFHLNESAGEHILIAGGIGITPMLAMGHRLGELNAKATLHYCTRSAGTTAFLDEAKDVFADGLNLYHDGGDPNQGIDLRAVLINRPEGAHLYICGPAGLIQAARDAASHWPEGTVHYELFAPPARADTGQEQAFEIFLSRSKKSLTVPPEKSILDIVREAGVDVDSSCESGICSTCRTRLISGYADHRDDVLTPTEKEIHSHIMICTSRAQPGETLILDL